jgi:hypothetical protein
MSLKLTIKNKNIRYLYRGTNEFKKRVPTQNKYYKG